MKPTHRWTVGAYLAGGENVSREMILALHDFRDAALAHPRSLRLLAQFEPEGKAPRIFAFDDAVPSHFTSRARPQEQTADPAGLRSREYVLEPETGGTKLSGLRSLAEFVDTSRSAAEADPLMVVISGHSSGCVGEFLGYRNAGEPVHLADLNKALKGRNDVSRKIDVLGMDCCHMSMVEVCSEVAPHARFLVASEGYILNHGWPYRSILNAIPGLAPEEAGVEIVKQFVGSYADYALVDHPSDCAVCDLERMPLVEQATERLARLLTFAIHDPDVWRPTVLAHWEAQSYKDEEYVDLLDFCDRLRLHVPDPEIRDACTDVIRSVNQVVRASAFHGSAFQFSNGLAIYFPWCNDVVKTSGGPKSGRSDLERYRDLGFSVRTGWGEFLDAYLWVTRREPRSPENVGSGRDRGSQSFGEAANHQYNNQEREVAMPMIKRAPPWDIKGGARNIRLKNHPRNAEAEGPAPATTIHPWSTKGTTLGPSRIKNHPYERQK